MKKEKVFNTLFVSNMTKIEQIQEIDTEEFDDIMFILDGISHSSCLGKLHELKSKGVSVTLVKNGETIIDDLLESFNQVDLKKLRGCQDEN